MADEDNSDDDLYGTENADQKKIKQDEDASSGDEPMDDGADSSDDEDDDSESDLEIIIDKPPTAPKATTQISAQESKAIKIEDPSRQQTSTPSHPSKPTATAITSTGGGGTVPQVSGLSGTAYPIQRTSTIDANGNPVYPPLGKEILSVDIDADLAEEQKIWRKPGEDQSDYFNYGFDEFTWELYRQRQVSMANTLQMQKNDMAQMQQMMGPMPGMPGMGGGNAGGGGGAQQGAGNGVPAGAPAGPGGAGVATGGVAPPMGPGGMNEQQQMEMMFQQMAQSGMDPSQMDFNTFMQMAGQGMGGFPSGPSGNQGGGGFQGNQGGGGRGGRGGRGRGW
ncbi:hypothetical protein ACN47E_009794 [Coniothyrium glycines]